ncbi:MAG: NAD(P)/FAD-dependent oxidoreductase, partial [Desulfobacterales bacterium]|nr:NAD(P)/FAD-dependent oxidoreductase [Desulfobacterales bacterium]
MKSNPPMKSKYEVIIVGAGMAALSAVQVLARAGVSVLVVDENPHAGGQLLRKTPGRKKFSPDRMKPKGFALARELKAYAADPASGIDYQPQSNVLGIFQESPGHTVQILSNEKIHEIQGETILLATGARERYLPFKGWPLPGVMSLGAAQILMKSSGVLPAGETLIAGTSPLQMALATEILSNGGRVSAILDENPRRENLNFLPLLLGKGAMDHWPKALEGAWYTARLAAAWVPHHYRTRIKEALGDGALEAVVTVKTDAQGRAIPGTEKTWETRALAVGCGFVPNVELAVQAGCRVIHDPHRGGWIMETSAHLESSCPGIYGAGEITGVAGVKKSYLEGRRAALALVEKLGKPGDRAQQAREKSALDHRLAAQAQYSRFLNRLCR